MTEGSGPPRTVRNTVDESCAGRHRAVRPSRVRRRGARMKLRGLLRYGYAGPPVFPARSRRAATRGGERSTLAEPLPTSPKRPASPRAGSTGSPPRASLSRSSSAAKARAGGAAPTARFGQDDGLAHDGDQTIAEGIVEDGVTRAIAPPRFDGVAIGARTVGDPVEELVQQRGRLRRYAPWHFLNFLPDPHQHGSLRPSFSCSLARTV